MAAAKDSDPYPFGVLACYESCKVSDNEAYNKIQKEEENCENYEDEADIDINSIKYNSFTLAQYE